MVSFSIAIRSLQREAIRRESRIELATEGQRYFDVRRWMIADKAPGQGGQGAHLIGSEQAINLLIVLGQEAAGLLAHRCYVGAHIGALHQGQWGAVDLVNKALLPVIGGDQPLLQT